jgi:integrase
VFCKSDGAPLCPDVLRRDVLYPALDRAGIERGKRSSGFHTFRHSAASFINAQTGNLKLAQTLLGHSTIDMTGNVYTHVDAKEQRVAAEALERAIYQDLFPIVPQIETGNKNALTN